MAMALHLFHYHQLISTFQIDIVNLMKFACLLETGYKPTNPYHNSTHAADVAQASHCCLQALQPNVNSLEKLAVILAAFTHDLDHPGVNQTFLIATKSPLATLYGSSSILEEHHWRMGVGTISQSGMLNNLDNEQFNFVVNLMKMMILATDVTKQPKILTLSRKCIPIDWRNTQHRILVLQMALKCADIGNPCKPWKIAQRWADRVCDEFWLQGSIFKYFRTARMKPRALDFCKTVAPPNGQLSIIRHLGFPLNKSLVIIPN